MVGESPNEAISCGRDGSVYHWDIRAMRKIANYHLHGACDVYELHLPQRNEMRNTVISCGADSTIKALDCREGKIIQSFDTPEGK
jgi:WD40 repeat protein